MTRRGDFITTRSGVAFWPLDPRPEEILIDDIAHALSNVCRWTGHVREFYSVAQHSYYVSELVKTWLTEPGARVCEFCVLSGKRPPVAHYGEDHGTAYLICGGCYDHIVDLDRHLFRPINTELVRTVSLAANLHDTSEAYISDVSRPVKLLPEMLGYRKAEATLQAAIYARFGLGAEEPLLVKQADNVLLGLEARDLMSPEHPAAKFPWPLPTHLPLPIQPVSPRHAKSLFLSQFQELTS